jgi:hypothetical protein
MKDMKGGSTAPECHGGGLRHPNKVAEHYTETKKPGRAISCSGQLSSEFVLIYSTVINIYLGGCYSFYLNKNKFI